MNAVEHIPLTALQMNEHPQAYSPIAVICLSPGRGGMELDAARTARILSQACNVVLIVRHGGHLDRARERLLQEGRVTVETIAFRMNYSPRMALAVRRVLRHHRVVNVIYFGSSELKSLRFSFLGLDINVIVRHGTTKNRPKRDPFHAWIYKCVNWHVGISAHLVDNIRRIFPIGRRSRIALIYPSVAARPLSQFRPPRGPVQLIHLGRVVAGKGQDACLRACARLLEQGIDFQLTLVGDDSGEEGSRLRTLADTLELADRVKWVGHVDDVFPYLLSADVFVFPSAGEGFGNALVEALCVGLVPVVFDNTALGEIMRLGFYGHLVPDGDERALIDTLVRVCAGIEEEKRRAYANAVRARQIFSEDREREEYMRLMR